MPDQKQTILEPTKREGNALGQRNDTNLEAAYPGSPRFEVDADDKVIAEFNKVLTRPTATGLGIDNFDPNFRRNGAPEISSIEKVLDDNGNEIAVGGGAGAPTTPYVPPLTSPGAGNFSAGEQGPWTGEAPRNEGEFGSGQGSELDPAKSSQSPKIGDTLRMGGSGFDRGSA